MCIEKLRAGRPITGTMLRMLRHPAAVTIAANAGFDMVMLDMEHGSYSFDTLSDFVLVARPLGLGVMVRVPELAKGYVSRALDCGVDGVMVPMLETPEQAALLAGWAKYPPHGRRGLGSIGGHSGYRKPGPAVPFMADADHNTIAIAQIETVPGVDNADAIAATPGIDALVVGPNDLANSLGKPGELTCPEQEAAINRIADAAAKHRKLFGMHVGTDLLRRWVHRDMKIIMNNIDSTVIVEGMDKLAADTRALIQP